MKLTDCKYFNLFLTVLLSSDCIIYYFKAQKISLPNIYTWYSNKYQLCYDSRHQVICLFTSNIPIKEPIQPCKAICNIPNDRKLNSYDKKILKNYEYEIKDISCPVLIGNQIWIYINYNDTIVEYENKGIKYIFRYIWSG